MPKPRTKRAKGKRRSQKSSSTGPSSSTEVYRGPVMPRSMKEQVLTMIVPLTYSTSVSSGPGGVLVYLITNNPSGGVDWSSAAAVWQEYRVLAQELNYMPVNHNYVLSTVTATPSPMIHYITRDSTITAVITEDAAFSYESSRVRHTDMPTRLTAKMNGVPDSTWLNTSGPTSTWAIGAVAQGLAISTVYGSVFNRWLVQFRGHR